jgi:hypothetical protein
MINFNLWSSVFCCCKTPSVKIMFRYKYVIDFVEFGIAVRETEILLTIIATWQNSQNTGLLPQGCLVKEWRSNKDVICRHMTFIATNPEQLHVLAAICCNTTCVLFFRSTQTKRVSHLKEWHILQNVVDSSCSNVGALKDLTAIYTYLRSFQILEEKDGRISRNLICV